MREFVAYIAKRLVDNPEQVILDQEEKTARLSSSSRSDKQMSGKVIGRKGRTAPAMRTLLAAIAAKEGKRAILEIAD